VLHTNMQSWRLGLGIGWELRKFNGWFSAASSRK
jgi:hypothetical protein